MQALVEKLQQIGSPRIALVGDFMLDVYVYGDTERISPEAPVPVLKVVRSERRVGGAGSVAAAIIALGARTACLGVIGNDEPGNQLNKLLTAAGVETSALIKIAARPTTVKTRYVGLAQHRHQQQMIRVDQESCDSVDESLRGTLRAALRGRINESDVVVIQDYNKGMLTDANTPEIIADAVKAHKTVIVDPARISDYRRYRGCTILKPNRYEAMLATGVRIAGDDSLEQAARQLTLTTDAQVVMITLDKDGIYLYRRDAGGRIVPTRPRAVYDVTGAGDEVLAMLAVAIGSGCTYEEAAALANVAGALEVERFGVVPIRREEIIDELRRAIGLRGGKVMERAALAEEMTARRRRGERIVFTNGCFDLLHMGHVRYLQEARELGNCLVVAINSDESVRRLKGNSRPVIGQNERAEMLSALECVDYVTVFEEDTPIELLGLLRPEILAKGGTTPIVVGRDIVEAYGGKVLTMKMVDGQSTTDIINRILRAEGNNNRRT